MKKLPVLYLFFLATVYLVWIIYVFVIKQGLFSDGEYWPVSLTMVLGSFVAGSSAAGGGSVAYPILTLILDVVHKQEQSALLIGELEKLQELKTGLLFNFIGSASYLVADSSVDETNIKITNLCTLLGKVYQITDDILDYESNDEILGKTSGKDKKDNKLTYVSLLGIDGSKKINVFVAPCIRNKLK